MKCGGGPGEGPQASSFKSLEKGLGKSASTDFHSVLESRPKAFADVGQRVLGVLRWVILIVAVALSGLFASVESSRADLYFESNMEAWCRPANPVSYRILRWKAPGTCSKDCFVWRLTCSNGKTQDGQSGIHPTTTKWQMALFNGAPWSFLLYLLPFVVYFGLAAIGAQLLEPLLAIDGLVLTYATAAAWFFYATVTGNPWGTTVWFEQAVFLNPYVYFSVIVLAVLLNLPAVWRGLDIVFFNYSPEISPAPAAWPGDPLHAAAMRAALMPSLHEFIDPGEVASHYRRETERVRALKKKFDAEAALAEAVIRRNRARAVAPPE